MNRASLGGVERFRTRTAAKLSELFGCDLRSLALFRIGLGAAVLADVVTRAVDLRLLYTDEGVLPRTLLAAGEGPGVLLSAHYWASASPALQLALFLATALCSLALLAGWRTWLATLACWYLVASVQIRQPLVYMGGDSMLRLLLFWSLFLPLGGRFSLDAAAGRARARASHHVSAGTVAILLQVCLMYWATGLRKSGPLWWSGKAIYYALHQDLATPLGVWLRGAPALLEPMTFGTLWLELLGPFLAFVPVATPWFRMATVLIFWLFHAGLATTMNIGLFPVFSMVGWLVFLPARFWEWVGVTATDPVGPGNRWRSRLTSVAAAVCLTYVVVLLAERTRLIPGVIPAPVFQVGRALRLQQTWNMFAPDPSTVVADYELEARRVDGSIASVEAGTSFRARLYVGYAVNALNDNNPLGRSLERFAARTCGEDAANTEVSLMSHARRITDAGPEPLPVRAVVTVRCGDVVPAHPAE